MSKDLMCSLRLLATNCRHLQILIPLCNVAPKVFHDLGQRGYARVHWKHNFIRSACRLSITTIDPIYENNSSGLRHPTAVNLVTQSGGVLGETIGNSGKVKLDLPGAPAGLIGW